MQRLAATLNLTVDGGAVSADQAAQLDSFLSRQGNLFNLRVSLASQSNEGLAAVEQYLVDRGVRRSHITTAVSHKMWT